MARQVQRRDEGSAEREGFVWSSRVRIAESCIWSVGSFDSGLVPVKSH